MKKLGYYARLWGLFLSYKRKKIELKQKPVRLWIEPTSHCNLKCVMCPNKDLDKKDKGFMELDLFKKIIDEVSGFAFDVHLLHRGESLLHPEFFQMARYAHDKKLIVKFHTNGTLLDEEKAHKLIESGIDQFSFSFDGYDKDTYERIRVGGNFDKTVGNIIRFLEIKKELKSKKPYTIIELINFPDKRTKSDRAQRREFLDKFKGLPLDKWEIREYHNWAGEMQTKRSRKNFTPCTFLWHALIVFWDGSVLPCTQDFFGYYILGNVKDTSVAEIWNNEKMLHLRQQHLQKDIGEFTTCRACDRVWREKFLGMPKEYLWKFLLRRMP